MSLTPSKAFVFGAVIIALALVFVGSSQVSSQTSRGTYMIAGDSSQFIWRLNVETGQVSYCARRDNSLDERVINRRAPICSAESAPVF
jgi:hypothetical protein